MGSVKEGMEGVMLGWKLLMYSRFEKLKLTIQEGDCGYVMVLGVNLNGLMHVLIGELK